MRNDIMVLEKWKQIVARDEGQFSGELGKMSDREAMYLGDHRIAEVTPEDPYTETAHLRNITAEAIEGQVNSDIPMPKVDARRQQDEDLAKIIETMLKNELRRIDATAINDMQERTVPIQGGGEFIVEWDDTKRSHIYRGELAVGILHPRQLIPQDGVYTGIEDMDHITVRMPQTKQYIMQRYGVDVSHESESKPEVKGDDHSAKDMVTQYIVYYRNGKGGIGRVSWVNDYLLEDIDDYQARRLRKCTQCGAVEPEDVMDMPTLDGRYPGGERDMDITDADIPQPAPNVGSKKKVCPVCGGTHFSDAVSKYEEIYTPITTRHGLVVPGQQAVIGPDGMALAIEPTRVPYYTPNIYPVILQKNVSVSGRFLGDSDVDKLADQQNTTNRIEHKIIQKLISGGDYITLPKDCIIETGPEEMKVLRLKSQEQKNLISVENMQGDISQDMNYLEQVYQESRQIIGLTDSYQGRTDRTATSGKAKEFSAAQAAGRMESKRRMKDAAWAKLFEAMFKFKLAYADEPRPIVDTDTKGNQIWDEFNRWDFLEQDEAGEYWWNDMFLFSVDSSATLSNNREAMWQETRSNFESGGFGDPADINTLIQYWTIMDRLHYPNAGVLKEYLQERQAAQYKAQLSAEQEVNNMLVEEQRRNNEAQIGQMISAQAAEDAKNAVIGS